MTQKTALGPKYALIEVPDFEPQATPSMSSFLRLGAYPKDPKAQAGYDLASKFPGYFDDHRARDGGPDFRPVSERTAETAKLFTRGGWWDHSDGNRISTTRGDKLEVIRGNYRLAVLGWQDDWDEAAGFDLSGGVLRSPHRLPGAIHSVEWKPGVWNGTWRVTEKTEKGDIHSTFHGNKVSHAYGDTFHDQVGSATPNDDDKPNPEIQSKTWAKSIKSYTGNAALPIMEMYDETWAMAVNSNTFLMNKNGTTTVLGLLNETLQASNIISNQLYNHKMSVELGQAAVDISLLATKSSLQVAPSVISASVHAATLDFNATAVKTDIFAGNKVGATLGGVLDLYGGLAIALAVAGKIDVVLGLGVGVFAGGRLDVLLGAGLDVSPFKYSLGIEQVETKLNWDVKAMKISVG